MAPGGVGSTGQQQQQYVLLESGDIYNIEEAFVIFTKSTIMMDKDIG